MSARRSDGTTMGTRSTLLGLPYTVVRHEYLKTQTNLALVAMRCVGFPTEGVQPVEWEFAIKVPVAELDKWPLGKSVQMAVTS